MMLPVEKVSIMLDSTDYYIWCTRSDKDNLQYLRTKFKKDINDYSLGSCIEKNNMYILELVLYK